MAFGRNPYQTRRTYDDIVNGLVDRGLASEGFGPTQPNVMTVNGLPYIEDDEAAQHRASLAGVAPPEDDAIDVSQVPNLAARNEAEDARDLFLANDEPEASPQQKGATNPYETSPQDKEAIDRAERQDRRHRIAQGILGAIGGFTGVVGSLAGSPVGGIGTGIARGAQNIRTNRAEEARANISNRQQQAAQYEAYNQQQEDRAYQREDRNLARQDRLAQADIRARSAESSMELNQARAEQARLEAQRMQSDWDSLRGNQAASVNWLRNLASMYDPGSNDLIRNIMTGTEAGGVLTGASQDQLDAYARQLTTLASSGQVAGRAEIGRGAGRGAGPARPSNPNAPSNPTQHDTYGELTAQERVIVEDAEAQGLDPIAVQGTLDTYRGANPAGRTTLYDSAASRRANRSGGRFVLARGLNQTEWQNDHEPRLDRAAATRSSVRDVANRVDALVRQYGANAVRLAVNGDPRVAAVMGADLTGLRAAIGRAVASYRLQMTGAGSSASEDQRLMNNLSMGTIAQSPEATARSLREMGDEQLLGARRTTPPDYLAEWERRNRERMEARRRSRPGGSR